MRNKFKKDFRGYTTPPLRSERYGELTYSNKNHRADIRKILKQDFLGRCGYCGYRSIGYGVPTFHIDHFISQTAAEDLINDKNNFVYCCVICNTTKGKKQGIHIDPVSVEYKKMFYRNSFGAIVTDSDLTSEKDKELSYKIIRILGLNKEIHKIDYIIELLTEIRQLEDIEINELPPILEVLDFINEHLVRKTNMFTE